MKLLARSSMQRRAPDPQITPNLVLVGRDALSFPLRHGLLRTTPSPLAPCTACSTLIPRCLIDRALVLQVSYIEPNSL